MQGDEELYTPEKLNERQSLRHHPEIIAVLKRWFDCSLHSQARDPRPAETGALADWPARPQPTMGWCRL